MPFVPGPEGAVKSHRSEERFSDDRVANERVTHVLGTCHGHIMAITVLMAMAMTLPCDGHDHAMFAGIIMVMPVSSSWPCHSQGKFHGQSHDLGESSSKGFVFGQRNELGVSQ